MTMQPMNTLPRNARFYGIDSRRTEYVVTCPACDHPDGFVDVIAVHGGEGGFFTDTQAAREVEVIEP